MDYGLQKTSSVKQNSTIAPKHSENSSEITQLYSIKIQKHFFSNDRKLLRIFDV